MSRKITRGARDHLLSEMGWRGCEQAAAKTRRAIDALHVNLDRQISLAILGKTLTTDGPGSSFASGASAYQAAWRQLLTKPADQGGNEPKRRPDGAPATGTGAAR